LEALAPIAVSRARWEVCYSSKMDTLLSFHMDSISERLLPWLLRTSCSLIFDFVAPSFILCTISAGGKDIKTRFIRRPSYGGETEASSSYSIIKWRDMVRDSKLFTQPLFHCHCHHSRPLHLFQNEIKVTLQPSSTVAWFVSLPCLENVIRMFHRQWQLPRCLESDIIACEPSRVVCADIPSRLRMAMMVSTILVYYWYSAWWLRCGDGWLKLCSSLELVWGAERLMRVTAGKGAVCTCLYIMLRQTMILRILQAKQSSIHPRAPLVLFASLCLLLDGASYLWLLACCLHSCYCLYFYMYSNERNEAR
jgi:hypothetical protein